MRIAHVVPAGVHPYSGLLTALVHLASALATRKHRLEVWHFGPWSPEAVPLSRLLDAAGVERVTLPPESAPFQIRRRVTELVEAQRLQIIHLHGVFSPYNNWLARSLAVPFVISPHGGYAPGSLMYHSTRKRIFRHLCELPMLRRARVVCALSEAEAHDVRAFGVGGSVAVIPNGVTPAPPTLDRASFRAELGMAEGGRLAVYAGRLDARAKRLDHLVRGMVAAPQWTLALIGGDFRSGSRQLRELTRHLGVADRVHLVEPRRGQSLLEALSAADLFVLLSCSEGMPMGLLEAAACGVPGLVSSEVERAVGQVSKGAGWVVEPNRVGEALQALASQDSEEWNRRRRAAAAWADEFRWSTIAERMERVYAGALTPPVLPTLPGTVSTC
jgi:glycosyltransferase involved in cell wall biosynthesis